MLRQIEHHAGPVAVGGHPDTLDEPADHRLPVHLGDLRAGDVDVDARARPRVPRRRGPGLERGRTRQAQDDAGGLLVPVGLEGEQAHRRARRGRRVGRGHDLLGRIERLRPGRRRRPGAGQAGPIAVGSEREGEGIDPALAGGGRGLAERAARFPQAEGRIPVDLGQQQRPVDTQLAGLRRGGLDAPLEQRHRLAPVRLAVGDTKDTLAQPGGVPQERPGAGPRPPPDRGDGQPIGQGDDLEAVRQFGDFEQEFGPMDVSRERIDGHHAPPRPGRSRLRSGQAGASSRRTLTRNRARASVAEGTWRVLACRSPWRAIPTAPRRP